MSLKGLRLVVGLLGSVAVFGCARVDRGRSDAVPPPGAVAGVRSEDRSAPAAEALPALGEAAGLSDYLEYAALNNAGLQAAFHEWQAALERAPQARTLPDPQLAYEASIGRHERRNGVMMEQMFPWFGKLELQGVLATEAAQAARQRYEMEKLKLFYRVKEAYYEYYYLAQAVAVVRENRDLVESLEGVVRARFKVAAAGHPDVIRAQVELGKLEDQRRTLEALREPIAARLNAAMNRPVEAPLPWPKSAPYEPVRETDDQVLAWLREASPELKALEHEVAGQRRAIDLAKKDYYPNFVLGVGYEANEAVRENMIDDMVMARVAVTIPFWRQKYAAGVREAEARHEAALKTRVERENTLGADVKMVLYRFRDAERKIDLYRDTLLPKARESLKATNTAFQAGRASFTDLIDAERILLEFALAYERALADHAQRLAQLEMLVGRPLTRAADQAVKEPTGVEQAQEPVSEGGKL